MPDLDNTMKFILEDLKNDIRDVSRNVKEDMGKVSDSITDLSKTVTGVSIEVKEIRAITEKQDKHLDSLFKGQRSLKDRLFTLENKKSDSMAPKLNNGLWGKVISFAIRILPQLIIGLLLGAAGVGYLFASFGQ